MGENVLKFGTYVRVGNAAEAYELLQKNRNNKIVGGGIWMRLGLRRVATAIDLSACGLDQIEETETEFRIGAMCTLRQLERHAGLNALVNNVFEFAVHDIVGVQLRNTATVGGSIYGRFGFSDVLSAFLALDSYVELTGAGRVPLAEFVDMGYVRDVIEHIVVVKHDYRASYEAVRKAATDFPSLNVTAAWWDNSWHVTVGARPLRVFFTITLPLTMGGVMSAVTLTLIPSLGIFFLSDLLGGGKTVLIGNLIQNQLLTARNTPFGAALSVVLLLLTALVMWVQRKMGGETRIL